MLGRIFAMLPFAENIAFKVNIISVLSSGLSVLFLYLIAVKLIENYRAKPAGIKDALITYFAAAIGALSFSFSDTFWFNGVEAEVYAFSTFLFGGVTWLMMCWHEKADQKDNEKYLLMIAYLIGVATGVHLMSVLAVVPVVMVIIFRKYVDNEEALKKTAVIFLVHAGVILLIAVIMWADQKSAASPSPEEYQAYDLLFPAGYTFTFNGKLQPRVNILGYGATLKQKSAAEVVTNNFGVLYYTGRVVPFRFRSDDRRQLQMEWASKAAARTSA